MGDLNSRSSQYFLSVLNFCGEISFAVRIKGILVVLIISIPDWGVTPFAKNRDQVKISNEIDAFNEAKRNETEKRGIQFVTITEISRLAATNKNYIAKDSLHFSGEMYTLWAKEIISNRFN